MFTGRHNAPRRLWWRRAVRPHVATPSASRSPLRKTYARTCRTCAYGRCAIMYVIIRAVFVVVDVRLAKQTCAVVCDSWDVCCVCVHAASGSKRTVDGVRFCARRLQCIFAELLSHSPQHLARNSTHAAVRAVVCRVR